MTSVPTHTPSSPAFRPMPLASSRLAVVGKTAHGHFALRAASKTVPGLVHDVLVSRTGLSVSCDCAACAFHPDADSSGRLTVKRADVLAGKVERCCWHLRNAARVSPLLLAREARS